MQNLLYDEHAVERERHRRNNAGESPTWQHAFLIDASRHPSASERARCDEYLLVVAGRPQVCLANQAELTIALHWACAPRASRTTCNADGRVPARRAGHLCSCRPGSDVVAGCKLAMRQMPGQDRWRQGGATGRAAGATYLPPCSSVWLIDDLYHPRRVVPPVQMVAIHCLSVSMEEVIT